MCRHASFNAAGAAVMYALKTRTPFERGQFDTRMNSHVWQRYDAFDQVVRPAVLKVWASDEQMHVLGVRRQKHRCLPCRIATANQQHRLLAAQPCLERRSPVVDSAAFETREVLDGRSQILCAARNDHRARGDAVAVVKFHDMRLPVAIQGLDPARDADIATELLR